MRRLVLALRLLLAAVFIYAAWTKIRQPWLMFALSIDAYRLLPEWAVLVAARTIPWIELTIGVFILLGWALRFSAAAAAGMLTLFFGVMLFSYGKGMSIDCGCFGFGETLSVKSLLRDGLLVASAMVLTGLAFRQSHGSTTRFT